MKIKTIGLALFVGVSCAVSPALADNALSLSNIVKDVMDATGKAVKGTAHGAEAVVRGTGNAVKNTAEGAGAVVRGTAHGAGALVEFSEKAVGLTPADPSYHAPVAGASAAATSATSAAATTALTSTPVAPAKVVAPRALVVPASASSQNSVAQSASVAPVSEPKKLFGLPFGKPLAAKPAIAAASASASAPQSLLGSTIDIVVDRHGNIIDGSGKLVGRVSTITPDQIGSPSDFAGQKLKVNVNGAGEMVDSNNRIIGHVLGAEPPLIPKDIASDDSIAIPNDLGGAVAVPTTITRDQSPLARPATAPAVPVAPASSWTEEDILKNTAPIMHGLQ